jgi:shikimate dehydrogenase
MSATRLYGVFGNPILHSKSPFLFNSVFSEGIDAFYTRIRPQSAADIIELMRSMPITGANITAPFKRDVVDLVDEVSLDAQEIGAINTIVNSNGRLTGYNTDHYGVTQSLREAGIELVNANCLVLGGGGAARSAVYGLIKQGANVFICNRTISKAEQIAHDFGCTLMNWQNFDCSFTFDVVVSTLVPDAIPCFIDSVKFKYLFDASYKPSMVYQIAQMKKAKIISGERWLLHQAIEAYRLFIGDNPPQKAMEMGLSKKLNKNKISVLSYPQSSLSEIIYSKTDLVVSAQGLEQKTINDISDEETRKALIS